MRLNSVKALIPNGMKSSLRKVIRSSSWQSRALFTSGAFDAELYRRLAGVAGLSDMEAARHYVKNGLADALPPHPLIEFAYFPTKVRNAIRRPDGAERLLRYLRHDAARKHAWGALFDPRNIQAGIAPLTVLRGLRDSDVVPGSPRGEGSAPTLAEAREATIAHVESMKSQMGRNLIRTPGKKAAAQSGSSADFRGVIERAGASSLTGGAVVAGWFLSNSPDTEVWVETRSGQFAIDEALRIPRGEVIASFGSQYPAAREPGFAAYIPGVSVGDRVRLRAMVDGDLIISNEVEVALIPDDAKEAASFIFGSAHPSINHFHDYARKIAFPALENVISSRRVMWDALPVVKEDFGSLPAAPKVSVIIPEYGRLDFVEHQLMEFGRDPWLLENAELVYVVDDPSLADAIFAKADLWARFYQVPFRVVWGGVNRGYSGANNLGVEHSTGEHLLFLNSDAIPQSPGWLRDLVTTLESDPTIGAVGPRLTFADGSMQHSGMVFRYRRDLHIWANEHPNLGLEPKLDPAGTTPKVVPAVTGACLLMRRADFDAVQGWDTGYLIGDFEDSDLCLKLNALGKSSVYVPTVQLTHLERQSFSLLGDPGFRTRVVIFNAVRHETRWGPKLKELAG